MEERGSSRLVTQRQLEAEPAMSLPVPTPKSPDSSAPVALAIPQPQGPSNRGLLERQLRWFKERAKFESRAPDDEGSK